MKKLLCLLVLTLGLISCSTEDNNPTLSGIYTESVPFSGTHQLHFIDNETLILKAKNSIDVEFIYELSNTNIKLIPIQDSSKSWELEINLINNSKFEITNIFYASLPEDGEAIKFVTFEK